MEYITLSNNEKMPVIGYGVFQIDKEICEKCVIEALDAGYRMIDTAQCYFNEEEVGLGVEKSPVPRKEIFLATKVWFGNYGYEETRRSVLESMEKLRTDYLDLCLLHQPYADVFGSWRALEDMHQEGLIRSIGVSNFYSDRMVDLCLRAKVQPVVNQIEIHPFYQREAELAWIRKYNIAPEAWAPLAEGENNLFNNHMLAEIGEKYNKSAAQVVLRWHLQRGIIVIPKSVHRERMEENLDVFDFSLTEEEMSRIAQFDRGVTLFNNYADPAIVEWFAQV